MRPSGFKSILALALTGLMAVLGFQACGAKAMPEADAPPPLSGVAVSGSGVLALTWALPEAGTPENQAAGVRVYRKEWPLETGENTKPKTLLMATLKPSPDQKGPMSFRDGYIKPGIRYEYHLFTFNAKEKLSADYLIGPFKADFPTQTVEGFIAEAEKDAVRLNWAMPGLPSAPLAAEPAAGAPKEEMPVLKVNLFRAQGAEGPFSAEPLNKEPMAGTTYRDASFKPGEPVRYKARLVRIERGVMLEGPFSAEAVPFMPKPATSLAAPALLSVKPAAGGMLLRWKAAAEPGPIYYRVERKVKGDPEASYTEASEVLTVDEFIDRKLPRPGSYEYRLLAFDRNGNRAYSPAAEAVYQPEPPPAEVKKPEPPKGK